MDTSTSAPEPNRTNEALACSGNAQEATSTNTMTSTSPPPPPLPRLPETTDVLILGTSVGHAALSYLLAMREISVLHVDVRDSYGGHQREELISALVDTCSESLSSDSCAADSDASSSRVRACEYKENERVDLCPSLVYADGPLINMLGT